MRIVKPSFKILDEINGQEILEKIERIGRTCYKSEWKIGYKTAERFVKNLIERGHESVLEHVNISVKIICDRGISHEIVRHRIASYTQESSRYCNYGTDKFDNEITVIEPCFFEKGTEMYQTWKNAIKEAENAYMSLLKMGAKPEEARSVLPHSLKTELTVTMNLREWRHFFKLRTAKDAHPQMREIACGMLKEFQEKIPIVFDNI